jgi:cobalt-precorrin-5B (C1)-methyltransferase
MNRELRCGYTTGSCAAAAALASARWLADGTVLEYATIELPDHAPLTLAVSHFGGGLFGVVKDAGDDPDRTNGMTVCAQVELTSGSEIEFIGGVGVGTVTLPGLKLPVGEPAINPVPRQMITQAVRSVMSGGVRVTVSIPGGSDVARRTFNPRLGIEGGLSVLGTTGIVKPMSEDALKESLKADLHVKAASGRRALAFAFGEGGERMAQQAFGLPPEAFVQMSNYVGFMLDCAVGAGIESVLISGHPGKLAKVAAGSMNTHSGAGDGRIEAICTQAALMGAPRQLIGDLVGCITTEAAIAIIQQSGMDTLWERLAQAVCAKCAAHARGQLRVEAAFLDNSGTVLGCSAGTGELVEEIKAWGR